MLVLKVTMRSRNSARPVHSANDANIEAASNSFLPAYLGDMGQLVTRGLRMITCRCYHYERAVGRGGWFPLLHGPLPRAANPTTMSVTRNAAVSAGGATNHVALTIRKMCSAEWSRAMSAEITVRVRQASSR